MKIAGWHVDGFGHLCDLEAHDLPAGLLVLVGPNGAGKSTLVDFLTGMLFGFPRGNTRLPKRPPQRGGQHGGRLWLTDDHGETLLIDRQPSRLQIHRGRDNVAVTPTEYDNLLGGASRRLFDAVFSVRLEDIASLDSLTDDELNDLVFSAGVVGAGRSATAVIDLLDQQRNQIYRPRGRTAESYAVLQLRNELRDAEEALAGARRSAASLPALRRSLAAAEHQADALRVELLDLDARDQRLGVLVDLWPRAVAAAVARRELAEVPVGPTVSPAVLARFEQQEAILADADLALAGSVAELDAAQAAVTASAPDPAVLAAGAVVDDLQARQPTARRDLSDATAVQARVAAAERQLADELRALGGVDRSMLAEARVDVAGTDELMVAAGRVAAAQATVAELTALAGQAQREQADRRVRVMTRRKLLTADVADLAGLDLAELEQQVGQLEAQAMRADVAVAAVPPVPSGSGPGLVPGVLVAMAVALLIGGVVSFVLHSFVDGAVLVAGGAFLAGLVALVVSPAERAAPATVATPVEPRLDRVALAAELVDARRDRGRLLHYEADLGALERDAAEAEAADALRLDDLAARGRDAAAALAEAELAWQAWLAAHGVPAELTAAGAARFCDTLVAARSGLAGIEQADAEAAALRARFAGFEAEVADIAAAIGLAAAPDCMATLELAAARVGAERAVESARHDAEQRAAARGEVVAQAQRQRARAAAAVAMSLADASLESGAALRLAAEATGERARLQAQISDLDQAVMVAAGAVGAEQAHLDLASGDPAAWRAARDEIAADRERATSQRDDLIVVADQQRTRLAEVERSADVATQVLEVEGLRSELQAALRRWTVLGLARSLVSETLACYQRERQPRVLARAQQLFDLVTEGAYPVLRTDERVVIAVDRAGRDTRASALSRGTREQLYLCLRFALAESFAERASLPIILDDVLVDFDPARAAQVAAVVASVAERHQVLAFTCHPWVRDLLVSAATSSTELAFDRTGELVPIEHAGGDHGRARLAPKVAG